MGFENADLFTKLHIFINQVPRSLKLDGTEWLTLHSFLHTFTTKTVSQIFDTCKSTFSNNETMTVKKEQTQTFRDGRK